VLLGNVAQARSRVEASLRSSSDPEVLRVSAKVLLAARDAAGAERLLRQATAADPLDCEAPALLARVITQSGRADASLEEYDEMVRRDPDNLSARVMAAILVHTQGKPADAKARYLEILKRQPRVALAANNLASIYTDAGENLNEAQELAERATELFPNHAGMRDTLGAVFLKRQLAGPALSHFQRSVDAEPTNPLYVYHLGLALALSGDNRRAADAFRRSLHLNPAFDPAKQALAALSSSPARPDVQ